MIFVIELYERKKGRKKERKTERKKERKKDPIDESVHCFYGN